MTIRLTEDQERFVRDAVVAGHYAGEDDVIRDALARLRRTIAPNPASPTVNPEADRPGRTDGRPVGPEELSRRLLASGLVLRIPDPSEDGDDEDDPPIEIEGEPLSETIIRERR